MRDPENIRAVENLRVTNSEGKTYGIDLMGFIFWLSSRRYVAELPAYLPEKCHRVGVFVNENIEKVKRVANDFALDFIQLHGSESPEYVRQLQEWKIIKAFNISTAADLARTKAYEDVADYFLFDTKTLLPGGSGERFDWSVLSAYHGTTPFLLSGGIGPNDTERIRNFRHPKCIGIDLNSRFEIAPAQKNVEAIQLFLQELSY
ncbi:MAG: phosphoribosylanthranilate isomerase [Bacteroidaceae bacterium]|nr:phosphoribosylanthranilate isomerase [Bacteroidaceae bacterium]